MMYLLPQILLLGLSTAQTISSRDIIQFPANFEIDLVFPRNDTYAVVSPFPIIFAFQNSNAFFGFFGDFKWNVECKNSSLFDSATFDIDTKGPAPSDPYFYINGSQSLASQSSISDPADGDFPYWKGDSDLCTLEWSFDYATNCTRQPDGSVLIGGGTFRERTGSVNFTISPGAKLPSEAIKSYSECPIFGTSVQIASNETTCPHIGDVVPEPKPCAIKINSVASSILAQVAAPTTTFVPTSTTSGASTATSSGSSSSVTAGGGGNGNGNGGGTNAATSRIEHVGVFVLLFPIISILSALFCI